MNQKKIKIALIIVGILMVVAMAVFILFNNHIICFHDWQNATCTKPMTCSICGDTKGEPFGHKFSEATCTEAPHCYICDEVKGEPLGHNWKDATYDAPKTCATCGKTEGDPLKKPVKTTKSSSSTDYTESAFNEPEKPKCPMCGDRGTRSDTQYCSMHDCGASGCPYPAKYDGKGGYGDRCEFHGCRVPGCTNYSGGNFYCATHYEDYING